MGGVANVVVNAVVRTLTRKAVGKVMKGAKAAGGKKKSGPKKKGSAKDKRRGNR